MIKLTHSLLLYLFVTITIIFLVNCVYAKDLNVSIEEISETRSTSRTSRRLNITLKVVDEILKNSAGVLPIEISNAYSDHGTQLTSTLNTSQANLYSFSQIENNSTIEQTIYLSIPKRTDKKIFIEGNIRIYKPQSSSIIKILNFRKHTQEIIQNSVLSLNGIELFFFTKKEFNDFLAQSKNIEEKAIKNKQNVHDALVDYFNNEIAHVIQQYNMNPDMYINDMFFAISGNWKNVVSLKVTNSSNEIVHSTSQLCGFSQKNTLIYELDLNGNLPSSANIVIEIIQKDDVVVYPFKVEADLP